MFTVLFLHSDKLRVRAGISGREVRKVEKGIRKGKSELRSTIILKVLIDTLYML